MDKASDLDSAARTAIREGEAKDVVISYKWDTTDGEQPVSTKEDIVERAIDRLLLKAHRGSILSGPIRIYVEHCQGRHRHHHDPLDAMRYLKVYVDGCGSSMVIAY